MSKSTAVSISAKTLLTLAASIAALGWAALLVPPHLRGEASLLDRIEAPLVDLRFLVSGPRLAPDDVVIVAIDDDTLRAASSYPVPRPYLARLLRRLAEAKPKAVALDMLLLDPGPEPGDAELAEALRASPTAIGAAAIFPRGGGDARASVGQLSNLPVAERLTLPLPRFAAAAQTGLVNVANDHGGVPRHLPLLIEAEGALQPALVLRAAMLARGADPEFSADGVTIAGIASPLDIGANLALRFYGPQGSFRTLSANAIVDGKAPADAVAGRIVVIGVTAFGNGDTLTTPFDPLLPGAELLATGIAHLTHGDALDRSASVRRFDGIAAFLLPLMLLLLLSTRRVLTGLALAGLVIAAFVAFVFAAFEFGLWLSLSLPLATASLPIALYLGGRLWLDRREETRLEAARDSLLRFHPPALAARLASDPEYLAEPVERDVAVLFVDLSGFTGLSERLGPARTRELLKQMHDIVEEAASPRGGSVTSFMGDGAMILFGLPEPKPDDADRAIEAALALGRSLLDWIENRIEVEGLGPSGIRIGLHAGPAILSRLGGALNQQITATGDTTNVAARLLEIAKAEGAQLVLTEALLAATSMTPTLPGGVTAKSVDVRGRNEPLSIRVIRDLRSPS